MTDRRLTRLLQAAPWLVIAVTAALLVGVLRSPPVWQPPAVALDQPVAVRSPEEPSLGLAELAVIWKRDLRGPLYDAPPQPVKAPEPPKLAMSLVGTVVEAQSGYAILRLADSSTVVKPVGSVVDGFEVIAVQRGAARLRSGQSEYELKVPWYDRIRRE